MTAERLLYEQPDFPVFQNRMFASVEEARGCSRGDIRLVQDENSGLVHNSAFRPELMIYDYDYQNEQAHSPSFQRHLDEVAAIVGRTLGTSNLVEVGCGKAYLLELLQSRGCSITGFDPAYQGQNPAVRKIYFDQGVAMTAHGIVLRHVLEHVQNPVGFLDALRSANGGGLIYLEVPCFDWIVRNRAWYDVFYEHVNYFRLKDFSRIFGHVLDGGHLFDGQYMYVVASLDSLRGPDSDATDSVEVPADFLPLSGLTAHRADRPRAVWGAASKGVIYSLLRERNAAPVEILIDVNPAKWGKFVPGTGLRVLPPHEGTDALSPGEQICVMNSNYLEEIRVMTGDRFSLVGVDDVSK